MSDNKDKNVVVIEQDGQLFAVPVLRETAQDILPNRALPGSSAIGLQPRPKCPEQKAPCTPAAIIAPGMIQDNCVEGYLFIKPTARAHGLFMDAAGNSTQIDRGPAKSICCGRFGLLEYSTGEGINRIQHVKVVTAAGVWEDSAFYDGRYDIRCRGIESRKNPEDYEYLILYQYGTDFWDPDFNVTWSKHCQVFHWKTGYLGQFVHGGKLGLIYYNYLRNDKIGTQLCSATGYTLFCTETEVCIYEKGFQIGCYSQTEVEHPLGLSRPDQVIIWFPESYRLVSTEIVPGTSIPEEERVEFEEGAKTYRLDGFYLMGVPVSRYHTYVQYNNPPAWDVVFLTDTAGTVYNAYYISPRNHLSTASFQSARSGSLVHRDISHFCVWDVEFPICSRLAWVGYVPRPPDWPNFSWPTIAIDPVPYTTPTNRPVPVGGRVYVTAVKIEEPLDSVGEIIAEFSLPSTVINVVNDAFVWQATPDEMRVEYIKKYTFSFDPSGGYIGAVGEFNGFAATYVGEEVAYTRIVGDNVYKSISSSAGGQIEAVSVHVLYYDFIQSNTLNQGCPVFLFCASPNYPWGNIEELPCCAIYDDGRITYEPPEDWLLHEVLAAGYVPNEEYRNTSGNLSTAAPVHWGWWFGQRDLQAQVQCRSGYFVLTDHSQIIGGLDLETFGKAEPSANTGSGIPDFPPTYGRPVSGSFVMHESEFTGTPRLEGDGTFGNPHQILYPNLCTPHLRCSRNSWLQAGTNSENSEWTYYYRTKQKQVELPIGALPEEYRQVIASCCDNIPFAVVLWLPKVTIPVDEESYVYAASVFVHVIFGENLTTYAVNPLILYSFSTAHIDNGFMISNSCRCDFASYSIRWFEEGRWREIYDILVNEGERLQDFLGADTNRLTYQCCGDTFAVITQGEPAFQFDYEILLKDHPEDGSLPLNGRRQIDNGSWLRLDDDTMCEAESVYSFTYTEYMEEGSQVIRVWTVRNWKFTDGDGNTRVFSNPFQHVSVDLERIFQFVPVKQIRKSVDVRGHWDDEEECVPPRQWLLHRRHPDEAWEIVLEDKNVKRLVCERYDTEGIFRSLSRPYVTNAQNGIFSIRANADEDYSFYSRTPPECDPSGSNQRYKEVIIAKPAAHDWMSNFSGNRGKGTQSPITGTVHSQRQAAARTKAIECNFAHRGTYFLEKHESRENNPDFIDGLNDLEFVVDLDGNGSPMFEGDKEAIARYDRVSEVSRLRQGFRQGIIDEKMSSFIEGIYVEQWRKDIHKKLDSEYRRSVYTANGVLHVIDPNFGLILVDSYGDVM